MLLDHWIHHDWTGTEPVHDLRADHWLNHGHLQHHVDHFYQQHMTGNFHSLDGGVTLINLPSDSFGILKLEV